MLTDEEIMAQVFAAFQEEQAEHRQAAGELLLELERDPDHPQRQPLLDQLFREAHSLKGGARAAGQAEIEQLAHRIEDIFSAVRHGDLHLTPDVCDPVYAALDAVGTIMNLVTAGKPVDMTAYQPLIATLSMLVEKPVQQSDPPDPSDPAQPEPDTEIAHIEPGSQLHEAQESRTASASAVTASVAPVVTTTESAFQDAPASRNDGAMRTHTDAARSDSPRDDMSATTVRLSTTMLDSLLNEAGELMTCTIRARQHAHDMNGLTELASRWRRISRQVRPVITRLQTRMPALRPTVHHLGEYVERQTSVVTTGFDPDTTLLLEAFMQVNTLMTELENSLASQARQSSEDHARLAAVTDRMHSQIRRTRMLPLTTILNPLRLQLRDMARSAGKQILLELDDGGAEADRQVLESLRDILLHLLRNAVDHGIEPASVRSALGKPDVATVSLSTTVNGDHLVLTVTDDGAGLNLEAITQRALSGGIVNEADVERLNASELTDLIFLPGFSTRHTVNELSGRGVGLDIVRSHVERMHGRVTVQTVVGVGTTFTLQVPLSLTSSHGLLLESGATQYVLPLDAVQRIVQANPQSIQILEGRAALILDNRPLALVDLADLLNEGNQNGNSHNGTGPAIRLALILGSGERQIACLIDRILGEQELVIHRLPAPLQRVRFVAGATILADGRVVPILDILDVVRTAIGTPRHITFMHAPTTPERQAHILVVDDSITTRTLEKNILEAAGYHVVLATDGVEAFDTLQRMTDNGGCDLLLSDIDMPRLNGFDLTRQIRADTHFQHLPIVLVTSLDTPAHRERGIAAGADAYIVKRSFDQQVLLDTIAQLI